MTIQEDFGRQLKATASCLEFVTQGLDSEIASFMDDRGWDAICGLAEVPPASWRTRDVVVGLLQRHEESRRRMEAISSPFDGLRVTS